MTRMVIINHQLARYLFSKLFDKFEEKFPFIKLERNNWYLDEQGYVWTDGALEGLPDVLVRIEDGFETCKRCVEFVTPKLH